MDHHAILVLHRGNVAAAAERAAGRNRREVAVYVLWRLKPLDASGRRVVGDADAGDRHAADLERIALALEDEGAIAPSRQPRTKPRSCGIQPAHESLFNRRLRILSPAVRTSQLTPSAPADTDNRVRTLESEHERAGLKKGLEGALWETLIRRGRP